MISPRMSSMTVCALLGVALDLPWPTLEIDHKVDAVWAGGASLFFTLFSHHRGCPILRFFLAKGGRVNRWFHNNGEARVFDFLFEKRSSSIRSRPFSTVR